MNVRHLLLGTTLLAAAPALAATPKFGDWGYDSSSMDNAVKPGDDFFDFVNGSWAKRTEIAADRTFVGIDSVLNDQIDKDVRAVVEDMAKNSASSGKIGQQVGDFYASWMDEAGIEKRGLAPLKPYLARVAAVKDKTALTHLFVDPSYAGPVGLGIIPDPQDPTRYVAIAGQGGLGMPNRDYYLLQGAKYDGYRKAYRDYVIKIQTLAGITDAAAKADKIIALETAIAKDQWTPERSREIKDIYNPMDRAKMATLAPQFDWNGMLKQAGLANMPTVVVLQPSAIQSAGKLVDTVPLQTWKDYVAYHFVSSHAQFLPKALDQANFDFFSKTLRDVPTQRDRWKRGVALVNGALGEGVGQIYVQRHYPAESDRQMGELIANIRAALKEKIETNSWMDTGTRKEALAKLASFDPRTGHPVKYIDYSSLNVSRTDLLGNAVRSDEFDWNLQLSRLPKPVDRTLWDMTPQTNNAYYDPFMNQITFPAAILQPPYFDPNADPASNYGSIGATIGHEIGHGFDDQGRQFDAKGRLRDWWTPATAKLYTDHAQALVKQYDSYEPIPGVRIKGQLTLGENLGDLGGLEVAYAAYRRYVAQHGEPPVIDGMTGDQRFFVAYGYSWQTKTREGALRAQLLTNEHSPAKYRVNGVVRNIDAWYKAFNIQPSDKMYLPPEQRVHVW
ncbi:M13 family metallopeptidase [Sphingomonas alba]|uniref:M13 family metallopeptidase n=1 Tax=Sphingomonas alba TaxID=2908208 RepID=A0ABT0RP81_9SPHN|nr:M13 family metallopeptidase [Sphingomonas alba]MCL6684443.1 M13 family metallopeptidase [Sphingomonas alba]